MTPGKVVAFLTGPKTTVLGLSPCGIPGHSGSSSCVDRAPQGKRELARESGKGGKDRSWEDFESLVSVTTADFMRMVSSRYMCKCLDLP